MRRANPGPPNFTEWSREEKEAFAKKRMMEMREKNQKLLMRYAEVQTDRLEAESRNSAVTTASSAKAIKKDSDHSHINEEVKVEYSREWDRGKPDKDHWKSPEHYESSFKNYRSSGRYDRKDGDRRDNWGNYSRDNTDHRRNRGSDTRHEMKNDYNEDDSWGPVPNKGPSRSFKSHASEDSYEKRNQDRKDTWSGYSKNESYKHDRPSDSRKYRGSYRYKSNDNQQEKSRLQVSPKRSRGLGYRTNDSHRRPQSSYSDDKYKKTDLKRSSSRKKYTHRAHSRSTSRSGSDNVNNQYSLRTSVLWQNDKINEDQTKQNRVERWVKSVNKTNNWGNRQYGPDQKEKNLSRISLKNDEKNYSKSSHDQDNNIRKPYSKFERFERSPDRSSDEGGNKDTYISGQKNSCVNSNYTSQNECDKVRSISKSKSFNPKPNDSFQKAGVQTKRSPHFSSSGSMNNENFRKLRRFENKDDNSYKPRRLDISSSSGNLEKRPDFDRSVNKNNLCNKSSKQDTSDGWNQNDDGIWGCAEQSDIKWKLSDEEPEMPVAKKQNRTEIKNCDDDDGKKSKKSEKCLQKEKKIQHTCDDDGTWGDVDQSNVHWNPEIVSEECENLNSHSNSVHLTKDNNSVGQKDEKSGLETSKSGTNDACIVECHSSSIPRLQQNSDAMSRRENNYSAEALISSFQQSLCIADAKNTNDSTDNFSEKPMVSDDGGWSTVSEEGEIHSDEDSKK